MPGLLEPAHNKGVSEPLSIMPPSLREIKDSIHLEDALLNEDCFRTDVEIHQLREFINRFGRMINEWTRRLAAEKGLPIELAENLYRILTIGSLKLKGLLVDEDIEIFVAFSSYVSCVDLGKFLRFLQNQNHLRANLVIVNGKVGFRITMEGFEMSIIMYYAKLHLAELPDNLNIRQIEWFRHMDEREPSVRSLAEAKSTFEMLDLVPNRHTFETTFKVIKLWSKRRATCSSNLGFLSNLAHAVLVARVCQMYPNAVPSVLVQAFFELYSSWNWKNPVVLKQFDQPDGLQLRRWSPCDACCMPIILPGYPEQNTGRFITKSGKSVITREFQYAFKVTEKILKGDLPWSRLYDKTSFFSRYKNFIVLSCYSNNVYSLFSLQQMIAVEIYRFIDELDRIPQISLAHISPRSEVFTNGTLLGFGPGHFICRFIGIELRDPSDDDDVDDEELLVRVLECSRVYMNYIYGRLSDYNLYTQDMDSRIDIVDYENILTYVSNEVIEEDRRMRDIELSMTDEDDSHVDR